MPSTFVLLSRWSWHASGTVVLFRTGILSRLMQSTDSNREWWSRFGAWVMIASVGWFAISSGAIWAVLLCRAALACGYMGVGWWLVRFGDLLGNIVRNPQYR